MIPLLCLSYNSNTECECPDKYDYFAVLAKGQEVAFIVNLLAWPREKSSLCPQQMGVIGVSLLFIMGLLGHI